MSAPTSRQDVLDRIAATDLGDTPDAMRAGFAARIGPTPDLPLNRVAGVDMPVSGDGPLTLLFHGGGYVFGAPASHSALAARLSRSGLRVALPSYPLAPEHPWPAQKNAALALLETFATPVLLAGISAGAHLALVAALARPEKVRALALFSPNTDRTGASATRATLSDVDAMNDDASDAKLAQMAMPDVPDAHPDASPWCGDLSALPRTHIVTGAREVLLDESLILARAAALAGVDVSLDVAADLFHMAPLWPDALPDAAAQIDRAGAVLAQVARSSAG